MATTHPSNHGTPKPVVGSDALLRDLFAMQALSGLCTPTPSVGLASAEQIATLAYRIADALIAVRTPAEVVAPVVTPEPVGAHVK